MKFKNLTLSPNSYVPNCQAPKLHESNNLKMVKTKLIKLKDRQNHFPNLDQQYLY